MKTRLAFSAMLLALSAAALTPAPTGAAELTGWVNCLQGTRIVPLPFASGAQLGAQVVSCITSGGSLTSVQFGGG